MTHAYFFGQGEEGEDKLEDSKSANVHPTAVLIGDVEIGEHTRIDAHAVITGPCKIGRYVHVGVGCFISGSGAGVELQDFSSMSPGVKVFSASDDYSGLSMTNPTVPAGARPEIKKGKVILCRHVIVGANSVILPGVQINEGTAVGALSLVTRDLDGWSIYGGTPAKWLKERKRDLLQYEQMCA